MKTLLPLLLAGSGLALLGCQRDEYVYHTHDHYRTVHHDREEGSTRTLPGASQHIQDHNGPSEFHAESSSQ